jgi:hypothetical protein
MKQKADIEILGIRHHGPGSARSLLRRLEDFAPDILLIEGPADAEHLIGWALRAGMQPPVAMLVYHPKQLQQAAFFPFAEFSPEWQAILYSLRRGIPARFMDLPMSRQVGRQAGEGDRRHRKNRRTARGTGKEEEGVAGGEGPRGATSTRHRMRPADGDGRQEQLVGGEGGC